MRVMSEYRDFAMSLAITALYTGYLLSPPVTIDRCRLFHVRGSSRTNLLLSPARSDTSRGIGRVSTVRFPLGRFFASPLRAVL